MPTDEIPNLDYQQVRRLMTMATSMLSSKQIENSELLQEVNLDFARTMNKIIFDKHMNKSGGDLIIKQLELPPDLINNEVA